MIGEIQDFDLKGFLFYFCVILGGFLIIISVIGMLLSWKSHWSVIILYSFFVTLGTLFFLAMGIVLIVVGARGAKEIKEMCSSKNADSDFQKSFNELYFYADLIYCRPPVTGCMCYTKHSPSNSERSYVTTQTENFPGAVTNVQGCKEHLEKAYTNYVIPFNKVDDLIEFLNYFGELESEYD